MRFAWIISIALMSFIPLFNAQVEYKYHDLFPIHHYSPSSSSRTISPEFTNAQDEQSYESLMNGVFRFESWLTIILLKNYRIDHKETPVSSPHIFTVAYALSAISSSEAHEKTNASQFFNATVEELTLPLDKSKSITKAIMAFLKLYPEVNIVMNIAMSHSCRIDPGLTSLFNDIGVTFYGSSASETGLINVTSRMILNIKYQQFPAVICRDHNAKNVNRILAETRRGTIEKLGDAEFIELSSDASAVNDIRMIFIRPNENNKTLDNIIDNFENLTIADFSLYEDSIVMFDIPNMDKISADYIEFNSNYTSTCTDYGDEGPHKKLIWISNTKLNISPGKLNPCESTLIERFKPINMSDSPFIILILQKNTILLHVVVD